MRKPVMGWESFYEITDAGDVYSIARRINRTDGSHQSFGARQMKTYMNSKGYLAVRLSRPGKRQVATVHRLVAIAFIANPDGLPEVNHIDGNKANPGVENLEWCTASQNRHHAFHVLGAIVMPVTGKLNLALANAMRAEYIPGVHGCKRLARKYGVSPSSARAILKGDAYPAAPVSPNTAGGVQP